MTKELYHKYYSAIRYSEQYSMINWVDTFWLRRQLGHIDISECARTSYLMRNCTDKLTLSLQDRLERRKLMALGLLAYAA